MMRASVLSWVLASLALLALALLFCGESQSILVKAESADGEDPQAGDRSGSAGSVEEDEDEEIVSTSGGSASSGSGAGAAAGSDDAAKDFYAERAYVLVQQQLLTAVPAQGAPLTFRYVLFNKGEVDAQNVKFTLPNFPPAEPLETGGEEAVEGSAEPIKYTVVEGRPGASVDVLPAGSQLVVDFTVTPLTPFTFGAKMTTGTIEYRYGSSDPPTEKVGAVATMGSFEIMNAKKYAKLNSGDPKIWFPFTILVLAAILTPLGSWFSVWSKYEYPSLSQSSAPKKTTKKA